MGKPHLFFAHFLSSLLGPFSSHLRKPHCMMNPRRLEKQKKRASKCPELSLFSSPSKPAPQPFSSVLKATPSFDLLTAASTVLLLLHLTANMSQTPSTPAQPSVYTPNLPRLFQSPWSNKAIVISGISIRFLTDLPASVLNYSLFSTHQNLLKDMSGHVMSWVSVSFRGTAKLPTVACRVSPALPTPSPLHCFPSVLLEWKLPEGRFFLTSIHLVYSNHLFT